LFKFFKHFFHPNLKAKVIYKQRNKSGEYAIEINASTIIGIEPLPQSLILIIPKPLQPNVIDLRNLETSNNQSLKHQRFTLSEYKGSHYQNTKVHTIRIQRYRD